MKNSHLLLFFFILLLAFACKTKQKTVVETSPTSTVDQAVMNSMWKKIDSLERKGLITTALEEVRIIKKQALEGKDSGHLVRAIMHENKYLLQLEEDSAIKALARLEEEINTYPEPARSVAHSLAGQWYGNYLQTHLWELRNRTEFGGAPGPDIRTWGMRHLIDKINEHYAQSIKWEGLKTAAVDDYAILLTEEQNTDDLRPTLYDILVHRALDFFSGTEVFLTKPAYDFVLTDPAAFSPVRTFVDHKFPVTDSLSNTWQSLQLFQELLKFRLADSGHEAALVDADLKRLRFVYDYGVIEAKDSLYENSLKDLAQKHAGNPESTLVDYHRAQLLMQRAAQWQENKESPYRFAYKEALEICRNAIKKFPDAYGSKLCQNLIVQIESKSISGSVESVNLPNENLLAQLIFRNLRSVDLKLVKLPEAPRRWRGDNWNGEQILDRLNQLPSLRTWKQSLNDGGDYQPHTTEIALPSLTFGHYALVISDMDDFDSKKSTTGTMLFTVSELGYWYIDDREGSRHVAVINRKTGLPIAGVKAEFFVYNYVQARERQEETKISEAISDANGWVALPHRENQHINIRLTKNGDELYEDEGYHTYGYGRDYSSDQTTLFFTDRSIYRPSQKIYFKGYVLNFDNNRIPKIASGKAVEVTLYDANGQEQMRKNFTSNEYGTIAGHFDLPSGGLTGQMYISSSFGKTSHYFQVEEYKRPKFEIVFDTLRENVRLNEDVTISGHAKDYAGSAVPNAEVRYRVERVAFRPWWYDYYGKGFWPRQEDRQVLTVGTLRTANDGGFDIKFTAKPKAGGDPNLRYRFETTVFVTDLTGESHELTKSITLNNQGYEVNITLPERISIQQLNEIGITALNSDGAMVNVSGDVEAALLKSPTTNKRNRLWQEPDILTISESEYLQSFTNYHLPGKEKMASWDIDRVVGARSVTIQGRDTISIASLISVPGYYRLSWKLKDANGKTSDITQYIMVYDESKPLPGHEVIEVSIPDKNYEPGQTAEVDLLTGISNPPKTIRVVERRVDEITRSWMNLPTYNDKTIKVNESDRGGIILFHLTTYNNRFIQTQKLIRVPWTNKELNVELKTWRDKMEPGDEETWTVTVKGQKQEAVTAEMLLSMYDASLDAFIPHQWQMDLYPSTYSKLLVSGSVTRNSMYWDLTHHWSDMMKEPPLRQYRDINMYGYYPEGGYGRYPYGSRDKARNYVMDGVMLEMQSDAAAPPPAVQATAGTKGTATGAEQKEEGSTSPEETKAPTPPALRSALEETVFFYPQIATDAKGNLTFSFKMKEGLTRWKFQALAHTKDLAFGLTQAEAVTQKQLMVFPNPPRFFREGDTIAFQIKTTNLTNQIQTGTAQLKIIDAATNQDVSAQWKLASAGKDIKVDALGSSASSWILTVPKKWITPVKYQVSATAGAFTDGEEAMLPVVTNRILVTETLPLPIKANEKRTFVFSSMKNSSATLDPHRYTVEMTTSPAWYAVQALPYLMEYPHECTEQIFNRFYANTLASHIAGKYPAIRQVYETWRNTNDDALLSNLQKNQELKSAMLEETPWVRDAMGESAQKKDIALLFETNKLRSESQHAISLLHQTQMQNGAWPWFPGGNDNWYISQYIVEGLGHLRKMGIDLKGTQVQEIIQRAVPYTDRKMIAWYDELKRLANQNKLNLDDHQISSLHVHYIYARSFFPEIKKENKLDEVITYVRKQAAKYWLEHPVYDQGLIALGFFRMEPNNTISKEILASLRQRTIVDEELGRYWKQIPGFYWYEAPVELQSLMIELYQDMKVPQAETDELRVWLLKQKQTTRWRSTKATSAAIYALLIHPDTWLESKGIVEVKLGNTSVIDNTSSAEAGTGYVKRTWDGDEIKDNWSSISVSNPNNHIAWGAAYYQYWEDIDKVKSGVENNPLQVTRSLLVSRQTDRGEVTNVAPGRQLKVGDKLIVRLVIETDRDMEFVHLKDLRASGFEPMDVISGYRWNSGLGYYQSTKDLATHFFIDRLPRGKFVIEYPVTVAQAGSYSEGLASLQCMYAPEFNDHSEGQRVKASDK